MQAKGQSGLQMQFSSVAALSLAGVYLQGAENMCNVTQKLYQYLNRILMWGSAAVLLWPRSSPTASWNPNVQAQRSSLSKVLLLFPSFLSMNVSLILNFASLKML